LYSKTHLLVIYAIKVKLNKKDSLPLEEVIESLFETLLGFVVKLEVNKLFSAKY
jgi:hypothetical protein